MITVTEFEASARLDELVDRVEAGETVSITRRGKAVARLIAEEKPRQPIDFEEMDRVRALSKPYVDPDGLCFVERLRLNDEL
ncbi:type II toxin-antitoxin system Phd/YefM family antitoxin [Sphingomonas sp.]|uniref:type II toxin-antitoxin system Phd/YefM family antitoxin n=1 Tax=Sphingomonas sp. TaxID=28214 RepID=UPI0035BC0847